MANKLVLTPRGGKASLETGAESKNTERKHKK